MEHITTIDAVRFVESCKEGKLKSVSNLEVLSFLFIYFICILG